MVTVHKLVKEKLEAKFNTRVRMKLARGLYPVTEHHSQKCTTNINCICCNYLVVYKMGGGCDYKKGRGVEGNKVTLPEMCSSLNSSKLMRTNTRWATPDLGYPFLSINT